jgi:hypothetical protein
MTVQLSVSVNVDLSGLQRYSEQIDDGNSKLWARIGKTWAFRMRAFLQRRFNLYSKGGGDWPPLAESTVAGRRKGRGKGNQAILRDTSMLFAALTPNFVGAPGALEESIPFGVKIGYGGPGAYPDGRATVADVASFHQAGNERLPQRQIIVGPDSEIEERMAKDAARIASDEASKEVGNGSG